ncbi:MAG: threonine synthase [Deltaproteobacteria bacterium]|jgi:threonine synthase|nr:threonine synthase [Deltaproteobacteria bacterium]
MKQLSLRCGLCGREYRPDHLAIRCAACGEPLEFEDARMGHIRESQGPTQNLFERYKDFLPFDHSDPHSTLGEGLTPLIESSVLAETIGILQLYLKNETKNPTWSFTDRGTASCIRHALELGYRRVGSVSSGSLGASVAAYGAKARLETFIIVDDVPEETLAPIAVYGPHLIRVACGRNELTRRSLDIGARNDIYFMNADAPMRIEGYKTTAYEICEQTNFEVPDLIVTPVDSGSNIRGIAKGFREFFQLGLIRHMPRLMAVQPSSRCSIVHACREDRANPASYSGSLVLHLLRSEGNLTAAISDAAMLAAQSELARAGLFVQPESAATYAALRDLKDRGEIGPDSRVACILTAGGLKSRSDPAARPPVPACIASEELDARIAGIIRQGHMFADLPH